MISEEYVKNFTHPLSKKTMGEKTQILQHDSDMEGYSQLGGRWRPSGILKYYFRMFYINY
jgi:hypothetical protein